MKIEIISRSRIGSIGKKREIIAMLSLIFNAQFTCVVQKNMFLMLL